MPAVSGIRSRKRQCPFPVSPWQISTSAPMVIVAIAAQPNADQFDVRKTALVIIKNIANITMCA